MYSSGKLGPNIKGTFGAELVDGLVIKEIDYKLVKTRFSAFFATHLHSFLQSSGINNLVIIGKWKFQTLYSFSLKIFKPEVSLSSLVFAFELSIYRCSNSELHPADGV